MLARYDYTDDQIFYLERLDYGNEDSVQYEYDDKGRILSATYEDGKTIEYTYDNSGRTATISDEASGTVSSFGYDYMDRVSVYTEENPDNKLTLSYSYYVANKKLKTLLEEINGHPRGASYVYDNDERLESYQKANGKREYTYDDFDRVPSYVTSHKNTEGRFVTVLTTAFTFASSVTSTTSARVASMTQAGNGFTQDYSYTYDKNGNILSATDPNGTTTYEYDSLGQLLRENNFAGNFTHVWEYDNAGNIESRTEYAYTTGELGTPINTVDYSYGDAEWGDLLTKYGDLEIEYDGIGNLERIGTSTLTWQHGRQLASLTSGDTTWTYTYNADGLRTKRTDGINTYEYVYYGGLLQYMEYNNTPVYFTHAPDGTPMGMLTGGKAYFYITNLQGDVVGIVDATGNLVVSYTYDAWGNPLSTTLATNNTDASSIAAINPIRYRGYVYDSETGLYYIESRYYNSEIGRFICSDVFVSTGQGIVGNNSFVYCGNNPVIRVDIGGYFWDIVFDVVSLVASVVDVVNNPDDVGAWAGLALDVVDVVVPCVGGLGEAADAVNAGRKAYNRVDNAVEAKRKSDKMFAAIQDTANTLPKGDNYVYVAFKNDGSLEYVGITNDFGRRSDEWENVRKIYEFASNLDRKSARFVEQAIIDVYGIGKKGGILSNKINSIGKKNPIYTEYLDVYLSLIIGTCKSL